MKKRFKAEVILHETLAFAFGGSRSSLFRSPFFHSAQSELEFVDEAFTRILGLVAWEVQKEGFGGDPVYKDHGPYRAWGEDGRSRRMFDS